MKTKEKEITYRPYKNGFPYKLLKYLYDNGKSAGADAQRDIGLNKWADRKGSIYFDRASTNFDMTARNLQDKGLIACLPDDYYEITKSGKLFIESYNVR